MRLEHQFSLKSHNTFGVDAVASAFVEYDGLEDLRTVCRLKEEGELPEPFVQIGGGSNVLFSHHKFGGTILHSGIKNVEPVSVDEDCVRVKVGSGYLWDDFVALCVKNGWYGAENLSLIPGEVGGAAVQNIGAYGSEVCQIIDSVQCFDLATGKMREFMKEECGYGYRESIFKTPEFRSMAVLTVVFRLSVQPRFNLTYKALSEKLGDVSFLTAGRLRDTVISVRRSKLPDPEETGSAGSFFKNPVVPEALYEKICRQYPDVPRYEVPGKPGMVKLSAGWLIDRCGWKGRSMGPVGVYDKQALVLVNLGGASGEDVERLSGKIVDDVRRKFGVTLDKEVYVI